MRRIRTIKPEFFEHEELYDAEENSKLPLRVAFVGLLTCCDREGRFCWRPRRLKLGILPYDNVDFSTVLETLEEYHFIVKYSAGGKTYGYIPSFKKHQYINNRESPSELPSPPISTVDIQSTNEPVSTVETVSTVQPVIIDQAVKTAAVKINLVQSSHHSTSGEVEEIFTHWCHVMNQPEAKLDLNRKTAIKNGLKLNYTVEQLCEAITGCANTPYNQGMNDRDEKFIGIHIIFKDANQIDRFRFNCHHPPMPTTAVERQRQHNLAGVHQWIQQKTQEGAPYHAEL